MENKKQFAKNSFLYLVAMLIPKVVGFLALPIYTRYILPEEYGIYSLTLSIVGVMAVLSSMGLHSFYLRNYHIEKDKKELNGTVFWSMMIWNILLFITSLCIMPIALKSLKVSFPFYPYMFLALTIQFFNSMEIIPMRTFRIKGEVNYYALRILAKTLLNVSLTLFFIIRLDLGVLGRYYGELISAFVFAIIFIIYMSRNSYFRISMKLLIHAMKFSLPIFRADVVGKITPMVTNIIIERILSLAQLGIYSIGITISSVIELVTSSLFLTIEPILYQRANSQDYPQFFKKLKNLIIVTVSIFCVGAGLFVREASILLLAETYWDSWLIVQVISISYIVLVLKSMYSQLIIIQGRTSKLFWGNIGYLISSVLVCIIALPIWGVSALGWSNVIGLLISFFILYINIDKTNYRDMKLLRDFIMMFLTIITLYFSRIVHSETILISIVLKIIIYIVYISLILFIYKIYPNQIINELIKRKLENNKK